MTKKVLSLILTVCMILPIISIIPTFAEESEPIVSDFDASSPAIEEFTPPDIVSEEEAVTGGYIARDPQLESDLNTLVFKKADGTSTMRIYSHPVKYIDGDGKIKDISLDIKEKTGGGYITAQHEIVTTFDSKLQSGVTLEHKGVEIKLVPSNVNTKATATRSGEKVMYVADSNTAYVYGLTYTGFKEDIIVKRYTGQTEYQFTLYTNGLELVRDENGSYFLTDESGKVKALIGDILVFTADEKNNTLGALTHETVTANEEYIMTIHIDDEYLASEDTKYPIRIDPSIELNYEQNGANAIEDINISQTETFSATLGSLYIGRRAENSLSRVLMRFPTIDAALENIPSAKIGSAWVELRDLMCQSTQDITVECYEYTGPEWSEASPVTWSTVGNNYMGSTCYSALNISYGEGNISGHRYGFDFTALAKEWAQGTKSASDGIVLKANAAFENQTGDDAKIWWKTFCAYNRSSEYRPTFTIELYNDGTGGGNSFESATEINVDESVDVSLAYACEKRYFKLFPSGTWYIKIKSSNNQGIDPGVKVYYGNGILLDSNNDLSSTDDNFSLIYFFKRDTTYYIEVTGEDSTVGSFKVNILTVQADMVSTTDAPTADFDAHINLGPYRTQCLEITPTVTTDYLFFSSNNGSTKPVACVYSVSTYLTAIRSEKGTASTNHNFKFEMTLNAGETYYFVLENNSSTSGSFEFNYFRNNEELPDVPLNERYIRYKNVFSEKGLKTKKIDDENVLWQSDFGYNWYTYVTEDGYYYFRSGRLYISVDLSDNSVTLNSEITDASKWTIHFLGEHFIALESKICPGKYFSVITSEDSSEYRLVDFYNFTTKSLWISAGVGDHAYGNEVQEPVFSIQYYGALANSLEWRILIQEAVASWNNSGAGVHITLTNLESTYKIAIDDYDDSKTWYGQYNHNTLTIEINTEHMPDNDNFKKSVIAHEIGHLLCLNDDPYCLNDNYNDSLMSHNRDRYSIIAPQKLDIHNVVYRYLNIS